METEVQIESANYESLEGACDGIKGDMPTAATVVEILSPDDMAGMKWWLEEWFLEWKTLADIRNDTDYLTRSQKTGKLTFGFNSQIKFSLYPMPTSKEAGKG